MRIRLRLYLAVVALVSLATITIAQSQATASAQDDRIVVGTNLVTLNVTVTDSKGRYVKGLAREQFEIYDNQVKQQVTLYVPNTENEPELTGICMQIAYELREQYSLGFYSRDQDGKKWRRLKVRINKLEGTSGLTLSYREGYQLAGN